MGNYFMVMSNGHIKEDGGLIEPALFTVQRSIQAIRKVAKDIEGPDNYSVFRCFPKFEAAYYSFKDFEKDESDEGTPLTKYLPK